MLNRRDLFTHAGRLATALAGSAALPPRAHAAYATAAFEARTLADLARALGASAPVESRELSLQSLDLAENGAAVPVTVASTLPGVRKLLVAVEKNPSLLSALFEVGDAVEPSFALRLKMDQSSNVYGLALLADGRALFTRKEVKVVLGGCGDGPAPGAARDGVAAEPTRIRAQLAGERATVRVLMSHAMESGQRKDAAGKSIPAWYIQELSALHNGRPVLAAQWGPSVSANPFLQFTLRAAKAGDRVALSWRDNRGNTRSDDAAVT